MVECKFIGAGVIDIPEKRWAEVRRHLKDNLGRLIAQDPDSVASSPYAPWLDAKKPIRKYFFCTSVFLPHHQSRILLQQRIHNDFIELSEQCHLPHLASIDVVVYCWNDFHGLLSSQFPLRYRWFGDLPIGIKPLALSLSEVKSFKLFLQEEGMPFFSRSKYLSGNGQPNVQWEEGWIVKLEQNETQAIIIAGAGGLGKTRLGLELSRGLANRGWLCLRLTNNATAERVGELVRAHIEAAKLIFFVDYAEIWIFSKRNCRGIRSYK